MRGITRAIVAVLLVVGTVPAVGAAQHTDPTDTDVGASLHGSAPHLNAAAAAAASSQGEHDGGSDGTDNGTDNGTELVDDPYDYFERLQCLEPLPYDYHEPELLPCEDDSELVLLVAGGDGYTAVHLGVLDEDSDGDGVPDAPERAGNAGSDGNDAPAAVSDDDWWDRVRCLRPLPVDPAPPLEPIPCEDDSELVVLRAGGDGGDDTVEGFPVQGGVLRVHRVAADGDDGHVRKKPGRTTYADITLKRGHVVRASNTSTDADLSLEHTDSWIVVLPTSDGGDGDDAAGQGGAAAASKAELIDSIATYEGGDAESRNVLGGALLIGDDGTRTTVLVIKELDKASPLLYEALASDHGDGDGDRTIIVEYDEIDKATPMLYEPGTGHDAATGLPTGKRGAADNGTATYDDGDGFTERATNATSGNDLDKATPLSSAAGPWGSACPIQWPTGPFDPNGPTAAPCPFGAVTPSDIDGFAGAVSPVSFRNDMLAGSLRSR